MITKWSEMPIGILQEIDEINGLHISDDEKTFMATALLAGMDYDDFINLSLDEARALVEKASFIQTMPNRVKVKNQYKIGNTTYVLQKDIMGITTAAYIDFQAILPTVDRHLPELMAIILVPKGHAYNEGYSNADAIEEIRENLNVEEALSIADFFTNRCEKLTEQILWKSKAAIWAMKLKAKSKEEREMLEVLRIQMEVAFSNLSSGFGYHWWKRWPK